jgi:hypothetical protein
MLHNELDKCQELDEQIIWTKKSLCTIPLLSYVIGSCSNK